MRMAFHVVHGAIISGCGMRGAMAGRHCAAGFRAKQHGRARHATHRQGEGEQQNEKNADHTRHGEKLSIG